MIDFEAGRGFSADFGSEYYGGEAAGAINESDERRQYGDVF